MHYITKYNSDMSKTNNTRNSFKIKNKIRDADVLLILDGIFFRTLEPLLQKFEETSEIILRKICQSPGKKVHIIFDTYIHQLKKTNERKDESQILRIISLA